MESKNAATFPTPTELLLLEIEKADGDLEACRRYLQQGAELTLPSSDHEYEGPNSLFISPLKLPILQLLLEHKRVDFNRFNKAGYQALHLAINAGNTGAVEALLNHGCPMNGICKGEECAPLGLALLTFDPNSAQIIQLLRARGATQLDMDESGAVFLPKKYINMLLGQRDDTQLVYAQASLAALTEKVPSRPEIIDLDAVDSYAGTNLLLTMLAIKNKDALKRYWTSYFPLVSKNKDIFLLIHDDDNNSPLHFAIRNDLEDEFIQMLDAALQAAPLEENNHKHWFRNLISLQNAENDDIYNLSIDAARNGNNFYLTELLKRGLSPIYFSGRNILHDVCMYFDPELLKNVCRSLRDSGNPELAVDKLINTKDVFDLTPLMKLLSLYYPFDDEQSNYSEEEDREGRESEDEDEASRQSEEENEASRQSEEENEASKESDETRSDDSDESQSDDDSSEHSSQESGDEARRDRIHDTILQALLLGADPNITNHEGKSSLYIALEQDDLVLATKFLEQCSTINLCPALNPLLTPLLHLAAETKFTALFVKLKTTGQRFDINHFYNSKIHGRRLGTPLDFATESSDPNSLFDDTYYAILDLGGQHSYYSTMYRALEEDLKEENRNQPPKNIRAVEMVLKQNPTAYVFEATTIQPGTKITFSPLTYAIARQSRRYISLFLGFNESEYSSFRTLQALVTHAQDQKNRPSYLPSIHMTLKKCSPAFTRGLLGASIISILAGITLLGACALILSSGFGLLALPLLVPSLNAMTITLAAAAFTLAAVLTAAGGYGLYKQIPKYSLIREAEGLIAESLTELNSEDVLSTAPRS